MEKLDKVQFEKENIFENDEINIEIRQEDDWEVATIKKVKYRHKKIIKKNGTKRQQEENKIEKNEIVSDKEIKEEEINTKEEDKNENDIEIKINNEK